jgi:hypothetical protein
MAVYRRNGIEAQIANGDALIARWSAAGAGIPGSPAGGGGGVDWVHTDEGIKLVENAWFMMEKMQTLDADMVTNHLARPPPSSSPPPHTHTHTHTHTPHTHSRARTHTRTHPHPHTHTHRSHTRMHHRHIKFNTTQPACTSATHACHMRSPRTPYALARTFVRAELMTWVKYGW